MKTLVLAEKPSVARDIARVLKCSKKLNGALEGERYIVTWALGHLVTLADPEEYDKKYKEWNMEVLPMMPKKDGAGGYQTDCKAVSGSENPTLAQGCAGYRYCHRRRKRRRTGCPLDSGKDPVQKAHQTPWISSVTDKAIREGFASLKDGRAYHSLYDAAVSRAEADWLVGINATRALTCKYNAQLSCGRVQTPTLAMIAAREAEIRSFKPQEYYGLTLLAGKNRWIWQDKKSGSIRSFQKERMEEKKGAVQSDLLQVVSVDKSRKKTYAPGLYDLTELQRDANKKFGFSAKETLNIMQRLYENHKVLTYPRTDSRYIGSDIVSTIKERLKACAVGPYRSLAGPLSMKPVKVSKSFVDDKKVSDHHAIIPTEQFVQLDHMTNEEQENLRFGSQYGF